mmetsp:Transcript_10497/g.28927  ORF Transcript_10497/g.28927 Transcript_10497/m.28927 type:complete len:206 (+) Transcript_10497:75-692(+)
MIGNSLLPCFCFASSLPSFLLCLLFSICFQSLPSLSTPSASIGQLHLRTAQHHRRTRQLAQPIRQHLRRTAQPLRHTRQLAQRTPHQPRRVTMKTKLAANMMDFSTPCAHACSMRTTCKNRNTVATVLHSDPYITHLHTFHDHKLLGIPLDAIPLITTQMHSQSRSCARVLLHDISNSDVNLADLSVWTMIASSLVTVRVRVQVK